MGTGTRALGVGRVKYKGYGHGVNLGIEVWGEQEVMYGNGASETEWQIIYCVDPLMSIPNPLHTKKLGFFVF
jgi:hypothetical protein